LPTVGGGKGWVSRTTKQATVVGGGKGGKGGPGGCRTCVPCTIMQFNLRGPKAEDDARAHPSAVRMDGPHQSGNTCPYCKCSDSKKQWKHGVFLLRKDCSKCRS
jgi:hypothetical protein